MFAIILGSLPRSTCLDMPGFSIAWGMGDLHVEVIAVRIDDPGADETASYAIVGVSCCCFYLKIHCRSVSWAMGISAAKEVSTNWLMSSVWFFCIKLLSCWLDYRVPRRLGVDAILKNELTLWLQRNKNISHFTTSVVNTMHKLCITSLQILL